MKGVRVGADREGSTITITVVSNRRGEFRFPPGRLEPGRYTLRIRAVGFELEGPDNVEVAAHRTASADLKLRKTPDLAAQLSNAEWIASAPGSDQEKAILRPCAHCHTLERIARSHHTADELVAVIRRMATYPQLSFPLKIQKLPAPRIGPGPQSPEQQQAAWRRQADYLTRFNLSAAPEWSYSLKTLPRPSGEATEVIYTEYDLPERTRQPHDVIVDSQGLAWYASFGEQVIGRLDPRTGTVMEYSVPLLKPAAPTGMLGARFDNDENLWLGMQLQGGIAKFERWTETYKTWSMTEALNGPEVQINQVSPDRADVDGKVWLQDA